MEGREGVWFRDGGLRYGGRGALLTKDGTFIEDVCCLDSPVLQVPHGKFSGQYRHQHHTLHTRNSTATPHTHIFTTYFRLHTLQHTLNPTPLTPTITPLHRPAAVVERLAWFHKPGVT